MKKRNKRRVFITWHHRHEFSIGENRQRFGSAAYHWGVLISPKKSVTRDCYAYDVSDGPHPDPMTGVDHNPNRDWVFRAKPNVNPMLSGHLLGRIMIGKVPRSVTHAEIQTCLESIPLPRKGVLPEENCVSWVKSAVRRLQEKGLAERFDIDRLVADSLAFADQRMESPNSTANIINYTSRPK